MERFQTNFSWAVVALATAGVLLGAAAYLGRFRSARRIGRGVGGLCRRRPRRDVAGDDHGPRRGLADRRPRPATPGRCLGSPEAEGRSAATAALVVAAVVLVRLVLNYNVLDYPMGPVPGLNWLLYGYGVPALAFYFAARMFRRERRRRPDPGSRNRRPGVRRSAGDPGDPPFRRRRFARPLSVRSVGAEPPIHCLAAHRPWTSCRRSHPTPVRRPLGVAGVARARRGPGRRSPDTRRQPAVYRRAGRTVAGVQHVAARLRRSGAARLVAGPHRSGVRPVEVGHGGGGGRALPVLCPT